MFTSCPSCYRQFRIHASQLSAATGMVRCGYCGVQFNALQRLSDQPLPLSKPVPAETPRTEDKPAVQARPEPDIAMETADAAMETGEGDEPQFDIPEILRDSEIRPVNRLAQTLWSLGAAVLVALIAAQVIWFNRDAMLSRYPQFRPWAKQFCERFHCQLMRERDTSMIKLLNRDVRLHPHYADTLLVNATMANQGKTAQSYPNIQFALFDTNGKLIAAREFRPEEYLDNSISLDKGMPPNQPVHFVLEIAGPARGAVGFEFRFL